MTRVAVTEKFGVSAERLWQRMGTFASLGDWSPAVESYECDGETPGSIRVLHVGGGGVVTERLVEMDNKGRSYTYTIEDSPLPVKNYRSTIRVQDHGAGSSTIHWSSEFEPDGAPEADAVGIVEGIYHSGLGALKAEFG